MATTTPERAPGTRYRIQPSSARGDPERLFRRVAGARRDRARRALGLHKSTVHRFLVNLEAGGWSSATPAPPLPAGAAHLSSLAGWCCSR